MPDLEAELRTALAAAAAEVTDTDLRRPQPPVLPHRAVPRRRWTIAACVAVVVALAAGAAALVSRHDERGAASDPMSLVGWVWSVTEVTHGGTTSDVLVQGGQQPFSPNSFYFLPDGRWGAADLLNAYEGTYTLDGATVRIHGGVRQAQSVGGMPASGLKLAAALEVLTSGAPAQVKIIGNTVTLQFGSDRLVATRPAATTSPIIGTSWRITEVALGTRHERMPGNAQFTEPTPTLMFSRSGVAVLADLSLLRNGHYSVFGSTLTLHDVELHPRARDTHNPALALLNSGLRELETPGVRIGFTVRGAQLSLVAGEYSVTAESLSKEPAPTPTPTFAAHQGKTPAFVGYRWNITAVEHGGKRVDVPASFRGSVTFSSRGEFSGGAGGSGQAGTYQLTRRGYVARNLIDNLMFGPRGSAGEALGHALRAVEADNAEVVVRTSGNRITMTQGGYVVIGIRGERIRSFADLQPVRDPAALTGITWTLTGISRQPNEVGGRPTFETPDASPWITFTGPAGPQRPVTLGCAVSSASVAEGHLLFGAAWSGTTGCPAGTQLGAAQAAFVFHLLSRNVSWSIYRGVLTIARPGIGTLRFHR